MSSKEKRHDMNKAVMAILFGCLTVLAACTKEVPYQYTFQEDKIENKGDIPANTDMILNISTQDVSRHTADGAAFMFGDNRRVRLEWQKESLRIIEKERDQRYNNEINDKILLEIPVEHVEFECAKDAYGDCTNKEAPKEVDWSKKANFKFKANGIKQGAIEFLPILFEQQVGSPCFKEVSSAISGYEISKDAINIQIKRNYLQLCKDGQNIENSTSEYNVSATFHYSLVRADSILSKEFQPVTYPKLDESTFGFFSSTYKQRDIDDNLVQNRDRVVMNHWNPNREIIDYHLSDSFNKAQNKGLKEATYLAVEKINQGLEKAQVKFRIKLHEPSGKNPGDIRNSMIVLAEDPYEDAPLGYGPQTEDPVTGEIISARTIMYLAGFKQYVRLSYDEIGRALKREEAKIALAKAGIAPVDETDPNAGLIIEESDGSEAISTADMKKSMRRQIKASAKASTAAGISAKIDFGSEKIAKQVKSLKNYTSRISDEYSKRDAKAYRKYLTEAKNCSVRKEPSAPTELSSEILDVIKKDFVKNGTLKPWVSLSDSEKQRVIDLLAKDTWIVTLLHELGHNLGLRHNFGGSEDKANFYSQEELAAVGVKHEVPYSSIMEYGDDMRALPIMGKYDIAALKYAYARKVDVVGKDGVRSEVSVKTNLQDLDAALAADALNAKTEKPSLVEYRYCTDEHVGPNAGCRRFDEGTTYLDIAKYLIRTYHERYNFYNTRSGLDNFSSGDDAIAASGRLNRFLGMRTFAEIYERIKHDNNLTDDSKLFETNAFLKDIKDATLLVNRFFISVIMTPDLQCAIANTSGKDAGKLAYLGPLSGVDKGAFDCWSLELDPAKYKVIGQTGKALNNKKHPDNPNNYIDQIDVRGYWLDKWAAARALFARDISASFNSYFDNAWDINDLKPELSQMIVGILENKVISQETFVLDNGNEAQAEIRNDFHSGHLIEQTLDESISRYLKVPHTNVYFSEVLSGIIYRESAGNKDNAVAGSQLQDLVSLKRVNALDDNTPKGSLSFKSGSTMIYASPTNMVAQSLIVDINVQRVLGGLDEEAKNALNTLAQEAVKAKKAITAEELVAAVPALTETQKNWLVSVSASSPELLADKLNDLAVGMTMSEEDIVKVLMGLAVPQTAIEKKSDRL